MLFTKVSLRSSLGAMIGPDGLVAMDILMGVATLALPALALWRLWHVLRAGARPLDIVVLGVASAIIGDRLLAAIWPNDTTWLGAGSGLMAAALLTPSRPSSFVASLQMSPWARATLSAAEYWLRGAVSDLRSKASAQTDNWSLAEALAHPEFPIIRWRQIVDTGQIQEDLRNDLELKLMSGIILVPAVFGLFSGGLVGGLIGLYIGLWLAPAANRNSVPPKLENVGGVVGMPGRWGERPSTSTEQDFDRRPVTELHEAIALLCRADRAMPGALDLRILWRHGDTKRHTKSLTIPWDNSKLTLSIESSALIYNSQIERQRYAPAHAIIARIGNDTKPVEIARDMGPAANLQHVFGLVTDAFGPEAQSRYRASVKRAETEQAGTAEPSVPKQPRPRPRL